MTNPQANCETLGCTAQFMHTHGTDTVYDTSNERAKTAEEIANELSDAWAVINGKKVGWFTDRIQEALDSYADSVAERLAEERVKACRAFTEADSFKRGREQGVFECKHAAAIAYKSGQERMRERAADLARKVDGDDNLSVAKAIRSLEVEEK